MSAVNDRHLTIKALQMALKRRCPDAGLLHHFDQSCTYASEDYQDGVRPTRPIALLPLLESCNTSRLQLGESVAAAGPAQAHRALVLDQSASLPGAPECPTRFTYTEAAALIASSVPSWSPGRGASRTPLRRRSGTGLFPRHPVASLLDAGVLPRHSLTLLDPCLARYPVVVVWHLVSSKVGDHEDPGKRCGNDERDAADGAVARDGRRLGRWDDDRRTPRPCRFVDGDRVIGGVSGDAHERALDGGEQIEGGGRIIPRRLGQRVDTDHAGLIDAKMELPPATPAAATVFRGRPLTGPDDGQTRAVEHEMEALAGPPRRPLRPGVQAAIASASVGRRGFDKFTGLLNGRGRPRGIGRSRW